MADKAISSGKNMQQELHKIVNQIPIFDELNPDELGYIVNFLDLIDLPKDEFLFNEGDKGEHMCFVCEGSLAVVKASFTGVDIVIAEIRKNNTIGEMALIDNYTRSATVKALLDTTLVKMTKESYNRILDNNPNIGIKILKKIAKNLSQNLRKTASRLADYLLPIQ